MTKPYYRLIIGKAPHTSADMRFGCGRIMVKVSDAWPDAPKVLSGIFDIDWKKACKKVLAFWESNPVSLADYNAGIRVELTEPPDRPLAQEVAGFRQKEVAPEATAEQP